MTLHRRHLWLMQGLSLLLLFSVVKLLLTPQIAFRYPPQHMLPNQWSQPLSGEWQAMPSELSTAQLSDNDGVYNQVLAYQQYQPSVSSFPKISLSLYYVTNTAGDMMPLLSRTGLDISGDDFQFQDHESPQGSYRLFEANEAVHLVSCLNPRGPATVSMAAFQRNRQTYDLQWQRLFPWLLGRTPLVDRRCLWVHLSVPAQQRTPQIDAELRAHWNIVSTWWQPHFPAP